MKFEKMHKVSVASACALLRQGKVIAYPTEAVYGIGASAFHQRAVERIHTLKGRAESKGFILLIAEWSQLFSLIDPLTEGALLPVKKTWPGFVTWVFPKSSSLPQWITGAHDSVAIRMTAHPVARALAAGGPIISTSANFHAQTPAKTIAALRAQFPQGIDALVQGALGGEEAPSPIYDVRTQRQLR